MYSGGGCNKMWSIVIAFISVLIPIIPMMIFAVEVVKFAKLAEENKEIEFCGEIQLKTLIPNKMKSELQKNNKVDNCVIEKIIDQYKKVFYTLVFYVIFWIGYISYIVLKFISLINYKSANVNLMPEQLGAHWGSWFMNIVVMWIFIINPICEAFGIMKKVVQTGYIIWDYIINVIDKISKFTIKWVENIFVLLFSFIMIYIIIMIWYRILCLLGIQTSFYTILPVLLIYQYGIIKLISKLIIVILKKVFNKENMYKTILEDTIQNSTYICLVGIYSYSFYVNKSNAAFPIAASILFLIDTYVKQAAVINEKKNKLKGNN